MTDVAIETRLRRDGVDEWLVEAVAGLARSKNRSLDPYLVTAGDPVVLTDTATTVRAHFVRLDPAGRPRTAALIAMLVSQVVDYCIPRSRIQEALDHLDATGSTEKILQLQAEARSLFTRIKTTGEGGELLLYTLLEVALGLPQILCKMSLKTSSQVHYHGVDGVHATALENGNLAIYWGEAKMYASVNGAIDAALKSIAPFVLDAGGGAADRDVLLLRDHLDAGDERLTQALVRYFTASTLEASMLEVRGACLVGFSLDDYPNPHDADGATVREEIKTALAEWHDRLRTGISTRKLESVDLEVFCVPLPSVEDFREALLTSLGLAS
jgi:hypothetical protein